MTRPTIILSDREVENEAIQFLTFKLNGGEGVFDYWLQARFFGTNHVRTDRLDWIQYNIKQQN